MHDLQAARGADPVAVYRPLLLTAAAVVAADQVTKSVALGALADGPVELFGGLVVLRLTFNPGGAFGVFQGVPGFFLVAGIAVVVLILLWARRLEDHRWTVPLGLVLGGGAGNLCDRILRDTGGRVVDFVDLRFWPVFNLADAAISIGVVVLLLLSLRGEPEGARR